MIQIIKFCFPESGLFKLLNRLGILIFFVLSVERLNVEFCFPECIWFKKLIFFFSVWPGENFECFVSVDGLEY